MSTTETLAYETVLEIIHKLPTDQQLSLVQTILQELSSTKETGYKGATIQAYIRTEVLNIFP